MNEQNDIHSQNPSPQGQTWNSMRSYQLGKGQPKHSKLEMLPPEIKAELDALISRRWGSKRIKKFLLERFKGKSPLLESSCSTYQHYISLHGPAILEAAELEKKLADAAKEDLTHLKSAMTGTLSLDGAKDLLQRLLQRSEDRIRQLELQEANASDPKLESQLKGYFDQQRQILETYHSIQKSLVEHDEASLGQELEAFTYQFLIWVKDAYVSTVGQEKQEEFNENLERAIKEGMDQWMAQRGIMG